MSNPSQQITNEPIRLHFSDQTIVVVTPDDEDRFTTTAAEAARACRQAQDNFQWRQEFNRFLAHIHGWCLARRESVTKAYVAFSNDGLNLFILTKGDGYRFDLDDMISALDIELAQEFQRCPTEVMHFPEAPVESLTSFLDSSKALQVYGV